MNVVQTYHAESDWCALVQNGEQRVTLTYAAEPEEAAVLEDAEAAFAAVNNPELVPVEVDETATLDDKKAIVRTQVTAASALASTEPELAGVATALNDVVETLSA